MIDNTIIADGKRLLTAAVNFGAAAFMDNSVDAFHSAYKKWVGDVFTLLLASSTQIALDFGQAEEYERFDEKVFVHELKADIAQRLMHLESLARNNARKPSSNENKGEAMDILISWSKKTSHEIASQFYAWLPKVLPGVKPWISHEDIDKGKDWFRELQQFLTQTKLCVIFVTKENVRSPWLYYESGAISAHASDAVRVCPYLVGVTPSFLADGPLAKYMATTADKDDTRRLLVSLNKVLPTPHDENLLKGNFETHWPEFEAHLKNAIEGANADNKDIVETDVEQAIGHRLSSEARMILLEASKDQRARIYANRTMDGLSFSTNGKNFTENVSAKSEAMVMQGLKDLVEAGLVEPMGHKGETFQVTGNGFKVAEALEKAAS